MRAMVLHQCTSRLVLAHLSPPECGPQQVRLRIEACGVCRTDLHIVDGDLKHPALPLIPGHEIVGRISEIGADVTSLELGQRVGVPWLGHTCGKCQYCRTSHENLTRQDGVEFFPLAHSANVHTRTPPYPLEKANEALDDLRAGRLKGAAVLLP